MQSVRGAARRIGFALLLAALLGQVEAQPTRRAAAQADGFDHVFKKYSKRYFGPAFDWRLFKAQGIAESNLDPDATSWVGARGVMQLMPSTYRSITSNPDDLRWIDDPEMNIAAGIAYDRKLWRLWESDSIDADRSRFMLASYNAGRLTILNAQGVARRAKLNVRSWASIARIAARVPRWRHRETLNYLDRITATHSRMDRHGAVAPPVTLQRAPSRGAKR